MKISEDGRAFIEAFEGLEKAVPGKPRTVTTYYDSVGVLTIGYGHTNLGNVPPRIAAGDQWTVAQADAALANDMAKFEADVARIMSGVTLAQYENDALVSFDFNTGDLAKSSIPAKIRAGNKAAAMATLLQYDHAEGKVLPGLTRRRQAEKLLFEGQVAAALKLAGAHVAAGDKMCKASPAPAGHAPAKPAAKAPSAQPARPAPAKAPGAGGAIAATVGAGAVAAAHHAGLGTGTIIGVAVLVAVAVIAVILVNRK